MLRSSIENTRLTSSPKWFKEMCSDRKKNWRGKIKIHVLLESVNIFFHCSNQKKGATGCKKGIILNNAQSLCHPHCRWDLGTRRHRLFIITCGDTFCSVSMGFSAFHLHTISLSSWIELNQPFYYIFRRSNFLKQRTPSLENFLGRS